MKTCKPLRKGQENVASIPSKGKWEKQKLSDPGKESGNFPFPTASLVSKNKHQKPAGAKGETLGHWPQATARGFGWRSKGTFLKGKGVSVFYTPLSDTEQHRCRGIWPPGKNRPASELGI